MPGMLNCALRTLYKEIAEFRFDYPVTIVPEAGPKAGDPKVYELFMQGVEGLRYFLPRWDYRKKWSLYSNGAYLCPPAYHCQNRLLLIVLARLGAIRASRNMPKHGIRPIFRC